MKRIVPSSEVDQYIHYARDNFSVRDSTGRAVFLASRTQAQSLIARKAVLGKVKKGDLEYLILAVTERKARRIAGIAKGSRATERLPVAEDNRTIVRLGRTFAHDHRKSRAYNPQADLLEHMHVCRQMSPADIAVELGLASGKAIDAAREAGEKHEAVRQLEAALRRYALLGKKREARAA